MLCAKEMFLSAILGMYAIVCGPCPVCTPKGTRSLSWGGKAAGERH
jgi:hypothetical protein